MHVMARHEAICFINSRMFQFKDPMASFLAMTVLLVGMFANSKNTMNRAVGSKHFVATDFNPLYVVLRLVL